MKTPSTELFELVKSLDLSEKRYCSLYLQKHTQGPGNRYLVLFNALKNAVTYNSAQVMQLCGFKNKPGHYAVLKNQLYAQLLDALHQYDLFTNPEQQLLRNIHQCSLLVQKGLFAQCEKQMKRLEREAVQMNHYEALLQLQNLKMILKARKYYRSETEADLDAWWNNTGTLLKNIETTNRYKYYSSLVYKMQYEAGARGKELAKRMQHIVQLPEFTNEALATTPRAKLDFLQVNALYCFTNLEAERAADYNQRFLALLEENPVLMQLNADRYFSVLNNYLIDCLVLKQYHLLQTGLKKLRGLHGIRAFKRLANFEANVFRLGYLLEMNYMITAGQFAGAYQKRKIIAEGLHTYGDKIVKHNRITLLYLSAYAAFALGSYNETLDSLLPILQEQEAAVAEDLQLAARMLQLLTHFERGDDLLIDSLVKSIQRSLLKKDEGADIQRAVVAHIKATVRNRGKQPDWKTLNEKLEKLAGHPKAAAALNLFNYKVWCQAHLLNTHFEKVWVAK